MIFLNIYYKYPICEGIDNKHMRVNNYSINNMKTRGEKLPSSNAQNFKRYDFVIQINSKLYSI